MAFVAIVTLYKELGVGTGPASCSSLAFEDIELH
jgi:hypothetical protein